MRHLSWRVLGNVGNILCLPGSQGCRPFHLKMLLMLLKLLSTQAKSFFTERVNPDLRDPIH